jgi:hypothetical protein
MPGPDISGDPPLAAGTLGDREEARVDEEDRLADPRPAERLDQPPGPLVLRHEGPRRTRHVVEGQRDPLLGKRSARRRAGGEREEQDREEQASERRHRLFLSQSIASEDPPWPRNRAARRTVASA